VVVEIRGQLPDVDALRQSLTKVEAERDAAKDASGELAVLKERVLSTTQVHRDIYAETMGRLVRREIAKAKSYQATPAKLRTWLENFYDAQEEDLFVQSLLPSVRLHLTWIGDDRDPSDVALDLVRKHFEESKAKISSVIEQGPDGYGELLQRVLVRWEQERAERFADALVREEIANGR
jgi:hypothetical protein